MSASVHMYRTLLTSLLIACAGQLIAQNDDDALRYSWLLPGGSARGWGLGSAMGAVGADPSASSLNPAGFGLYNTTEMSFTSVLEVNDAEAMHYGTSASASITRAAVQNFAMVLCYPGKTNSDWKASQIGLSFDREATFHYDRVAQGSEVNSTLLQQFVNEADGTPPDQLTGFFPYTSGLAWDTYAIDPLDTISNSYLPAIPFGSDVRQSHTTENYGRSQTTSLFASTNYQDRLYLGASLGLMGIRYERTLTHTEQSLIDTNELGDFSYVEELVTTGGGIDLKVGAILRVTKELRMGLSYHSPRWMQLDDSYYTRMSTEFRTPDADGNFDYSAESPSSVFRYRVNSPWSLLASAAYVVGKAGLVSVDYGFTDYSRMDLKGDNEIPDSYDFDVENALIQQSYRGTHSVRVGTEWRAGNWYMRGGWGWWQDPYADTDARQGTGYRRYTLGGGYRTDHLSIDLALNYATRSGNYFVYDPSLVKATSETITEYRGMLTLAYRP